MATLGYATMPIVPSLDGFRQKLDKQLTPILKDMSRQASAIMDKSLSGKGGGRAARAIQEEARAMGGLEKTYQNLTTLQAQRGRELSKASARATAAAQEELRAQNRLSDAENALNKIRQDGAKNTSALSQKLSDVRQKEAEAAAKVAAQTDKLHTIQAKTANIMQQQERAQDKLNQARATGDNDAIKSSQQLVTELQNQQIAMSQSAAQAEKSLRQLVKAQDKIAKDSFKDGVFTEDSAQRALEKARADQAKAEQSYNNAINRQRKFSAQHTAEVARAQEHLNKLTQQGIAGTAEYTRAEQALARAQADAGKDATTRQRAIDNANKRRAKTAQEVANAEKLVADARALSARAEKEGATATTNSSRYSQALAAAQQDVADAHRLATIATQNNTKAQEALNKAQANNARANNSPLVNMRQGGAHIMQQVSGATGALDKAKAAMSGLGTVSKNTMSDIMSRLPGVAKAVGGLGAGFAIDLGQRAMGAVSSLAGKIKSFVQTTITGMGAATAAVAGFAAYKGFDRLQSIEQAEVKLETFGINVEQAMAIANEAVVGTAFGLDEATTSLATLSASGIEMGEDMQRVLNLIGDTATITGSSFGEISTIFSQIAAAGKLYTQDMNQLQDRGIGVLGALAEANNKTVAEMRDDISKGAVSFQEFADVMEDTLGGAAQRSGDTVKGAFANIKAALGRTGASALSPLYDELPNLFKNIATGIDNISKVITPVMESISEKLAPALDSVGERFVAFTETLPDKVIEFVNTDTFKAIEQVGKEAWAIVSDVISFAREGMGTLISAAAKVGSVVWSGLKPVIDAFRDTIPSIASSIGSIFSSMVGDGFNLEGLKETAHNIGSFIARGVQGVAGILDRIAQSAIPEKLGALINGLWDAAKGFGTVVVDVVKLGWNLLQGVGQVFSSLNVDTMGMIETTLDVATKVANLVSGVFSVASGILRKFTELLNKIPGVNIDIGGSGAPAFRPVGRTTRDMLGGGGSGALDGIGAKLTAMMEEIKKPPSTDAVIKDVGGGINKGISNESKSMQKQADAIRQQADAMDDKRNRTLEAINNRLSIDDRVADINTERALLAADKFSEGIITAQGEQAKAQNALRAAVDSLNAAQRIGGADSHELRNMQLDVTDARLALEKANMSVREAHIDAQNQRRDDALEKISSNAAAQTRVLDMQASTLEKFGDELTSAVDIAYIQQSKASVELQAAIDALHAARSIGGASAEEMRDLQLDVQEAQVALDNASMDVTKAWIDTRNAQRDKLIDDISTEVSLQNRKLDLQAAIIENTGDEITKGYDVALVAQQQAHNELVAAVEALDVASRFGGLSDSEFKAMQLDVQEAELSLQAARIDVDQAWIDAQNARRDKAISDIADSVALQNRKLDLQSTIIKNAGDDIAGGYRQALVEQKKAQAELTGALETFAVAQQYGGLTDTEMHNLQLDVHDARLAMETARIDVAQAHIDMMNARRDEAFNQYADARAYADRLVDISLGLTENEINKATGDLQKARNAHTEAMQKLMTARQYGGLSRAEMQNLQLDVAEANLSVARAQADVKQARIDARDARRDELINQAGSALSLTLKELDIQGKAYGDGIAKQRVEVDKATATLQAAMSSLDIARRYGGMSKEQLKELRLDVQEARLDVKHARIAYTDAQREDALGRIDKRLQNSQKLFDLQARRANNDQEKLQLEISRARAALGYAQQAYNTARRYGGASADDLNDMRIAITTAQLDLRDAKIELDKHTRQQLEERATKVNDQLNSALDTVGKITTIITGAMGSDEYTQSIAGVVQAQLDYVRAVEAYNLSVAIGEDALVSANLMLDAVIAHQNAYNTALEHTWRQLQHLSSVVDGVGSGLQDAADAFGVLMDQIEESGKRASEALDAATGFSDELRDAGLAVLSWTTEALRLDRDINRARETGAIELLEAQQKQRDGQHSSLRLLSTGVHNLVQATREFGRYSADTAQRVGAVFLETSDQLLASEWELERIRRQTDYDVMQAHIESRKHQLELSKTLTESAMATAKMNAELQRYIVNSMNLLGIDQREADSLNKYAQAFAQYTKATVGLEVARAGIQQSREGSAEHARYMADFYEHSFAMQSADSIVQMYKAEAEAAMAKLPKAVQDGMGEAMLKEVEILAMVQKQIVQGNLYQAQVIAEQAGRIYSSYMKAYTDRREAIYNRQERDIAYALDKQMEEYTRALVGTTSDITALSASGDAALGFLQSLIDEADAYERGYGSDDPALQREFFNQAKSAQQYQQHMLDNMIGINNSLKESHDGDTVIINVNPDRDYSGDAVLEYMRHIESRVDGIEVRERRDALPGATTYLRSH